jgi:hypothetical protein
MTIEIDKTLGHEAALRAGIEALHKTVARTPANELAEQISADMTFLVNQAINNYVANPGKPGATLGLSQLTGYLGELATLAGKMAAVCKQEGYQVAVHDADEALDKLASRVLAPAKDRQTAKMEAIAAGVQA